MKKALAVWVFFVFFVATPAVAQGPYLGAGLFYSSPLGSDIDYLRGGPGLDFTFGYDFGPVGLEGTLLGSRHSDSDPGYSHADFRGFSMDFRIFFSAPESTDLIYLLAGLGGYSVYEYDPFIRADTELKGTGWNFGAGMEHFVNTNMAAKVSIVYRRIWYDEYEINGELFSLRPRENGDMLTIQAGFNYHF